MEILVVSQDPAFITEVQSFARSRGSVAVGCLGPLNVECPLYMNGRCSLSPHRLVIVDAPEGVFKRGNIWAAAGAYAGRLKASSLNSLVVLNCPEGKGGPSNGAARVTDRTEAMALMAALLDGRSGGREMAKEGPA